MNVNETTRIKDLKPDAENARRHNPRNIEMIASSLNEVGAARSIVIDEDDVILAGNGVLQAARAAGIENVKIVETDGQTIIAVRRSGLTTEQKKRLAYFDNRTAELADWSPEQVLADLDAGFDLSGLWDKNEIDELLAEVRADDVPEDPGAQVDKAAELQEKWKVEWGQVWEIPSETTVGKAHRMMCGDSTVAEDVERLMGREKAGAIIADPPYGMRLNADFSGMVNKLRFAQEKGVSRGRKYGSVIGDDQDFNARPIIIAFGDPDEQLWFGADYYASTLPDTEHSGAWLVWDKRLDEMADKMFGSCFELLWSKHKCRREVLRYKWAGIFGTEHEPQRGRQHPNQKPVILLADLVSRVRVNLIVDPFLGSGTTIVACEQTGRIGYGMEIEPKYCAVALERLAGMGLEPHLTNS